MALTGSTNEQKIWNYLKSKGLNDYGVAGLMGNLYAESGLKETNLQNSYEKSLGYTDEGYTKAVDNGKYTNFVNDSAGYGLAQWTYWSRKQNLFRYSKSKNRSIGDLEMQLEFLYKELSESYKTVLTILQTAKSVLEASNAVLLKFERPANQSESVQQKRASYGTKYYNKYHKASTNGGTNMGYTNSSLVNCTVKSPNHSGTRTHKIDRITPHCVVGQLSAESIGGCFTSTSRQASCNYGIGYDGRVCLIVDEKNRSWCTSSNANDQRAITIECASDAKEPYTFNKAVYSKLVTLCIDICKRNGIKKVLWFGDKNKSLNYAPKDGECVLTVHRWFANKSCPGNWMYSRMGQLANEINAGIGTTTSTSQSTNTSTSTTTTSNGTISAGTKLSLKNTALYASSTSKLKSSSKTGTYYVWSKELVNNRIRITNSTTNVGKSGQVTGWITYNDAKKAAGITTTTATTTTTTTTTTSKATYKIGDIVKFTGTKHYTSASAINGTTCKPGTAKVTSVYPSGKHIYHLVAEKNGGSTVYGWVDASAISGLVNQTATTTFQPYRVRITADVLNVRKGAGTNYATNGSVKKNEVYTIVGESTGKGATKWLRLKSGAGFIASDYAKRI